MKIHCRIKKVRRYINDALKIYSDGSNKEASDTSDTKYPD